MKTLQELIEYIKTHTLNEREESMIRSNFLQNIDIELDDDYFMNREKRRVQ